MKTVNEVIKAYGNAALVHRHASYTSGYLPEQAKLEVAHNYSRTFPDVLFPLDLNGIKTSIGQGEQLAEMGIKPLIWISDSARGIRTGVYIW